MNEMVEHKSNMIPLGGAAQTQGGVLAQATVNEALEKVKAAIILAKQFPRDRIKAMDAISNACQREGLANAALYEYAKGGSKITGPSIRLAETIAQNWGNIEFGWDEVGRGRSQDGVGYSEIVAFAWDMETNVKRTTKFQVKHWRDIRGGGYPLRDEREVFENNANLASRRLRACIINLIPADVMDGAVEQCERTLKEKVNITPERIKGMIEAFAAFGVTKEQIEKRIQCRVDAVTPSQMLSLTKIYNSMKDGMSSAHDWFDASPEKEKEDEKSKGSKLDQFAAKVAKEKVAAKKEEAPVENNEEDLPLPLRGMKS